MGQWPNFFLTSISAQQLKSTNNLSNLKPKIPKKYLERKIKITIKKNYLYTINLNKIFYYQMKKNFYIRSKQFKDQSIIVYTI